MVGSFEKNQFSVHKIEIKPSLYRSHKTFVIMSSNNNNQKICHEKGCTKFPSFNKARKTSGRFCYQHKKEGMVSIMYRHYNNQLDEVFKKLPRELQWEILVDFVGGYVVRNNRLRRLMSGEIQRQMMENNFEINELSLRRLWAKPFVKYPISGYSYRSNGDLWEDDDPGHLRSIASAEFSRQDVGVVLFESRNDGKLSYGYNSWSREWYITEMDDSVVLPPYEKHVYPSYPYTNKKLGRPALKMKLHNPIPKDPPIGLDYNDTKRWMAGKRFRF